MQVKKLMTKNPACCTPDSTLQEVAQMMEMYDCGCIPVINNHQEKRPVGTITDRDIAVRTFGANKNPLEMKASDIMTTDIAAVTPETSVEDCLNMMENKQIRRILVVDKNGMCVGIVAQADVAEQGGQPRQTAEFVREVSESNDSSQWNQSGQLNQSNQRNQSNPPPMPPMPPLSSGNQSNRWNQSNQPNQPSQWNQSRSDYSASDYSHGNEMSGEERNYQSFSKGNRFLSGGKRRHKKNRSFEKSESFFSGKTLLTLLASIGIGAGIKYYLENERENKHREFTGRKIKTYDLDTGTSSVRTEPAIHTSTTHTTPPPPATGHTTPDKGRISGSVDSSLNTTTDRTDDLKPTSELGRTATNK